MGSNTTSPFAGATPEQFVRGGHYSLEKAANAFGVSREDVCVALAKIGVMYWTKADGYRFTQMAHRLHLGSEGHERSVHSATFPHIVPFLGPFSLDSKSMAEGRQARIQRERQQTSDRLKLEGIRREEEKRAFEARLSLLPGFARVEAHIAHRINQIRHEYLDHEWQAEMRMQQAQAVNIARDCSFDESYPDFEDELIGGRVVFTLDEQMVAARRFVESGRATAEMTQSSGKVHEQAAV